MADEFDPERDLFVSDCIKLETFIRMSMSTGYSDREVCAVFLILLKELFGRQKSPEEAKKQFIDQLMGK
jgi:hypothetical protein